MGKMDFKPGNMLYPLPAVLVTVRDGDGKDNLFTVAWAGTVCTNPPMLSVSVRPSRHSYKMMKETGVFAVNLTTRSMAKQTDYCGVRAGRDHDKWEETGLSKEEGKKIPVSVIAESPVNIECRVRQVIPLGSHDLFLADVVHVSVDEQYMDEKGAFHLEKADPIVYSHGKYFDLGAELGKFGYSVKKKNRKRRKEKGK